MLVQMQINSGTNHFGSMINELANQIENEKKKRVIDQTHYHSNSYSNKPKIPAQNIQEMKSLLHPVNSDQVNKELLNVFLFYFY